MRRPSAYALDRLLAEAREASPTYSHVGAIVGGGLPDGYRRDVDELRLGTGPGVFERAVAAVQGWRPQLGAGIEVVPEGVTTARGRQCSS